MQNDPTGKQHEDVTATKSQMTGFSGIRRQQPSKRNTASSPESYHNASFDKSSYQGLGAEPTSHLKQYAKMTGIKSGEQNVGA